ncbi:MAG: peptidoglycan DD-metalloendopeptidase family protein [Coriobacteriales bacterium]|jgi:murein DD-endopeptidase MepM/ murein hydrolase activator NlpD|nr:peptidoglycan DD-metalloendopeptidase family protein [Coriobacteriales bacterium]
MQMTTKQNLSRRQFALLSGTALVGSLAGLTLPFSSKSAFAVTSAEKRAEAEEAAKRLDALQTELNVIYAQYDEAVSTHNNAISLMQTAEQREVEAEARLTEVQSELGSRANSQYRNGKSSYLDVLFGSTSFSEFVSSMDMINRLNARDAQLIADAKTAKQTAEEARSEYMEQEAIAAEKETEIAELKEELEVRQAEMQDEVNKLTAEAEELQAQEELAAEQARLWAEEYARKQAANGGTLPISPEQLGKVPAFIYPLSRAGVISSGFGERWGTVHLGLDIAISTGTPILAAAAGTIVVAAFNSSGGNWVWIEHGNGVRTKYMHASAFDPVAVPGNYVAQGTVIAYVGSTGNSTGPHLHFQVEIDGQAVDPVIFLP